MNPPQTFPSDAKKWSVAFGFMLGYGALVTAYFQTFYAFGFDMSFWVASTAAVGGFMLATSFAASSVSHFTGWPNMKLGYQKQIGVLAYWLCVAYCFTLLASDPATYYYGFFENLGTPNFILGLSAMTIFTLMVAINSKLFAGRVGWPTISLFLNLGYVGYAFLVMRAILLEWPLWVSWFTTFDGLPTNRFILSVLAMVVLLLRLAVIIDRNRKRR